MEITVIQIWRIFQKYEKVNLGNAFIKGDFIQLGLTCVHPGIQGAGSPVMRTE